MTYAKVNVDKPGINKGIGGNKKAIITFIDLDDVSVFPSRDSKGIVIENNIIFKNGAYMITVYGTIDTIKSNRTTEGDIDAEGIMQSIEFSHPGDEVAILEFQTNWLSRNIAIIVERCSDNTKRLYGSPCAPLRMAFNADDDKDKNANVFTLKSSNKGPNVADYRGTLTYDDVTGTVAADETEVDLTNGEGRYQLTDGTVAVVDITTATNAVDGMVFTLLGSGGDYPSTITAGNDFILSEGTQWSALAGSQITFRAKKTGPASWVFIEQSRV